MKKKTEGGKAGGTGGGKDESKKANGCRDAWLAPFPQTARSKTAAPGRAQGRESRDHGINGRKQQAGGRLLASLCK